MSEKGSKILLFIDNDKNPLLESKAPVEMQLDTTRLTDGEHCLKIVSVSPTGKEGIKKIRFHVRNGPAIDVNGIKEDQVVDGVIPFLVNAYDKGNQKKFNITGSETPQAIPSWLWFIIITFFGWAIYYMVMYLVSGRK